MKKKPVIGLTPNYDTKGKYFSTLPWYCLRENHCTCLHKLGATPFILPMMDEVGPYLDLMDGLVITGGDFDIHPSYYGEEITHARVHTITRRTEFELEIASEALKRNMPILGVCGGHQLLNILFGGSLIQHIPDTCPEALTHEQPNSRSEPGHEVTIVEDTLLYKNLGGKKKIEVNTAHHQAVAKVGEGLKANAYAPDGIIEGIEHPDYAFCIGVQWHPEYSVTAADDALTAAFIHAAAAYQDLHG